MATPRWIKEEQRWRLDVQYKKERLLFYSNIEGSKGKKDVLRQFDLVKDGESPKYMWKLEKVWPLYLDDVLNRKKKKNRKLDPDYVPEKSENYIQREKLGRLYILPLLGSAKMTTITSHDWQRCINEAEPSGRHTTPKPRWYEREQRWKIDCVVNGVRHVPTSSLPGEAGRLEVLAKYKAFPKSQPKKSELSYKTLSNIKATIQDFCRFAKAGRIIDEMPVGLYVPEDAPVIGKPILQPDQFKLAYYANADYWYYNADRMMMVTGLRPGEVFGIQDKNIDGAVLAIRQAVNSQRQITKGKNKNAQREMLIHEYILEVVTAQKEQLMRAGIISPWLFPAPDGSLPVPNTAYRQWKKFATSLGIESPPYALRHTAYSINKQIPKALLDQVFGHAADTDSNNLYGHVVNGDLETVSVMMKDNLTKVLKRKDK